MLGQGWLPLNDYSTKYNISISTLRRRIRGGSIENQFRDGKYWLRDAPTGRAYQTEQPDLPSIAAAEKGGEAAESSTLEMANKLVAELKSAYVLILQEKEEQILLLKEEVADLKTLVRILESENQKFKSPESAGEWLNDTLEP